MQKKKKLKNKKVKFDLYIKNEYINYIYKQRIIIKFIKIYSKKNLILFQKTTFS